MSLPPYKIREFTATSGNHCRMKMWINDKQPLADCDWDVPQSEQDENEVTDFFNGLIAAAYPGMRLLASVNITEEDSDRREALIKSALVPGHDERN